MSHDDDTCPHLVRASLHASLHAEFHLLKMDCWKLRDDNIDLKAEVERLTASTTRTIIPNEELQAENARLKADVERLAADLPKMVAWGRGLEHDKRLLQEENARLRAAGDQFAKDMVSEYGLKRCKCEDVYINWLAAKGELP